MSDERRYVSRAGEKLAAALHAFAIDVTGRVCTDLGSHAGGFVDCLLQHGAARVHAVDPGYGVLDARLRADPRVCLHERTNALRYHPPEASTLVTIDVGWTQQRLILPVARRLLTPGGDVITLVKPHYEAPREWLREGVLMPERLTDVLAQVRRDAGELGWSIAGEIESPLLGHGGNAECLWRLRLADGATSS
jgi:23S rRNA (cytidine1920-2'-O)/16S rRNA (cytidine1409-2'-O)-methyltransferase